MAKQRLIERDIFPEAVKALEEGGALVITGMRRTGKTTLLAQLRECVKNENCLTLDLQNPLHRKFFETDDYDAIMTTFRALGLRRDKRMYVFLDEIQLAPSTPSIIKYLSDNFPMKFIVTGSSSFAMKHLFSESLVGRKRILELFPFSFAEFLRMDAAAPKLVRDKTTPALRQEYRRFFAEYMQFGGFPEVVRAETHEEKLRRLEDIFTSYYQFEVEQFSNFRKGSSVRDLMLLLLNRVGSKMDVQKMTDALHLSRTTIYEYLSFLEATYFFSILHPWSASEDVSLRRSGKPYVIDGGLLKLTNAVSEGVMLEQAVFQALRRKGTVTFYHRRTAEIDFILDGKTAYEVKRTATSRDAAKIQKLAKECGLKEWRLVTLEESEVKEAVPAFLL